MSSGSDSQPANTTNVIFIRYAPYIEERHVNFLETVYSTRVEAIENSPYADIQDVEIDDMFFNAGYDISSFPALYDVFGRSLAGLDIEIIFNSAFESIVGQDKISDDVRAESALISDRIAQDDIKRFMVRMRDLNAVCSSSYIVGMSLIECNWVKEVERMSLDKRFEVVTDVVVKFNKSLDWQRKIVTSYAQSMKDYYTLRMDFDEINSYNKSRNVLWPFEVLDFENAALGALVRAATYQKIVGFNRSRSALSTALTIASATVQGASIGGSVGGGYGALGGAVIGFKIGVTQILLERGNFGWVAAALTWAIF
jgi:hypothetical protein